MRLVRQVRGPEPEGKTLSQSPREGRDAESIWLILKLVN